MATQSPRPEQPSDESLAENVSALPHVGKGAILDAETAGVFHELLKESGIGITRELAGQIDSLYFQLRDELGPYGNQDTYTIPNLVLRGIVARCVIVGAVQALNEVGGALHEANELSQLYGLNDSTRPDNQT